MNTHSRSIREILKAIGTAEFIGDPEFNVSSPAPLAEAGPDQISFVAGAKFASLAGNSKAGCLLISHKERGLFNSHKCRKIFVDQVWAAWISVLRLWDSRVGERPWGIDPAAQISRSARLGRNVSVGALAVIEDGAQIADGTVICPQCYVGRDAVLGEGCILYPRSVILERCRLGKHVIIHSGAVIGSDGFGFATIEGRHEKVPQIGDVVIEDDVEIGANSTIDRATIGTTRIGTGTKIDNLVQVAHNVTIGKYCLLAAQVGIAGSSRIGDYVLMGGQAGVKDHVEVAGGTMVGGQAGIINDIKEKSVLWGTPARPHREALRQQALLERLPELLGRGVKIK